MRSGRQGLYIFLSLKDSSYAYDFHSSTTAIDTNQIREFFELDFQIYYK